MTSRENVMRCPLCGQDGVPEGARFCTYCKRPLPNLRPPIGFSRHIAEHTRDFTGREWVFQAVDDWLADPEGTRVFLLSGGPGTGKTAIAAQLLRMAAGEAPAERYPHLAGGSLHFFQFCQALHNDTLDPLRFTKGLSLQLARQYPYFADALVEAGARDPGVHVSQQVGTADRATIIGAAIQDLHIGNLSARVAFDRVVAGPLKQMPQADLPDTILILLDAMDEALTYPGETLVDLLAHALDDPRDLPPRVRFLLTSRPDQRVTHALGQPALDLIADAPADVDDVRAYVHRRLRALAEPRRSELARRIAGASQGNFLYARYVIDDLPPDLDEVEDPAGLPLPEDLYDVYRQFLKRELGRSLDTWDDDYGPLLGVLAVTRGDGLTSAQVAGVTEQRRGKMRRLLRACGQYLAGPQPDGPFRIYHQSFRDFLLEDETYQVYPREANQAIADFYRDTYGDGWEECDHYGLHHLPLHLVEASYDDRWRALLLDFDWLRAKLATTDVTALIADTSLLPADGDAQLLGEALRLSAHVLARDRAQLWSQLYGRLMGMESPAIQAMLADPPEGPWLRPLRPILTAPGGALLFTLTGHTDDVTAVAVYDGGRRAVSASYDRTLKVWDLERGRALRTIEGHAEELTAVAVYDSRQRAICASRWDHTLEVWDLSRISLQRGQALRALVGHRGSVLALAVYDGGRRAISASQDRTLKVWDLSRTGLERDQALATLKGHTCAITAVAVYDGGRRAISGAYDGTLKIWDLERGQELHTLTGHAEDVTQSKLHSILPADLVESLRTLSAHTYAVNALAVYDGGRRAISASRDHTLKVWDLSKTGLEGGQALRTLKGHNRWVTAVAVYDGGQRAVSASDDRTLKIWDLSKTGLKRGQALATLEGHSDGIAVVAVYDGGRRAISASRDNTLKVWDLSKTGLETGQALHTPEGHSARVTTVVVYDGGRRAISASEDTTLRVWDLSETGLESGRALCTLEGHSEEVIALAVYDAGRRAISAATETTLRVWDLERGHELRTLSGHSYPVTAMAVDLGGRRAVSASGDEIKVWDLDSGHVLHTLEGHSDGVYAMAVAGGGRRAISASLDATLKVWDLDSGQVLHTLEGHSSWVAAVAVYDSGRRAISASLDKTLKVWDLEGGRALHTLDGRRPVVVCDGGRRAVSASFAGTLKVWDLECGQELRTLEGHSEGIRAVAVYDSGRRAVSASDDRTLKVWDLGAGVCLHTFSGDSAFWTCAVTPDGRTIVAGDVAGQVHILRLEGGD